MKINNLKRASAVVLASLNAGTVFAQNLNVSGKTVAHNHSNFKKHEQTKKTGLVDLPQIATILGIGGLLFVGADELVVRPIINKFSRKSGPNPLGKGAGEKENLSVFIDEKYIINSVFDNMKRYGNNKEVNNFLEEFRKFGLKLCDCNFGSVESVTVEELYNNQDTGLKELLDIIVKNSSTSSMYSKQFENTKSLLEGIKFVYKNGKISSNAKKLDINKGFAASSIISEIGYQLNLNCVLGKCVAANIAYAVYVNFFGNMPKNMRSAHIEMSIKQDIDDLCASLTPIVTGENKGNLKENADQFLADPKYATAKEKAIALLDKYVDFSKLECQDAKEYFEKRFDNKEYPEKNVKNVIAEIMEICRDTLKEDYELVKKNIQDYFDKKSDELIPYEE